MEDKTSVKFQEDMLNFHNIIQVVVFTTNTTLTACYHSDFLCRLIISCYRKKFSSFDMWGQTELLKSSVIGPELEENWNREFDKFKARYIYIVRLR